MFTSDVRASRTSPPEDYPPDISLSNNLLLDKQNYQNLEAVNMVPAMKKKQQFNAQKFIFFQWTHKWFKIRKQIIRCMVFLVSFQCEENK